MIREALEKLIEFRPVIDGTRPANEGRVPPPVGTMHHSLQPLPGEIPPKRTLAPIDWAIGDLLVETVSPLALSAPLEVGADLAVRSAEADALRRARVERAR